MPYVGHLPADETVAGEISKLFDQISKVKQVRRQRQIGGDILSIIGAQGTPEQMASYMGGQSVMGRQIPQPQAGQSWIERLIETVNPMTAAQMGPTSLEDAIMGRMLQSQLDPLAGLQREYLGERIKATKALAKQREKPTVKRRALSVFTPKGKKQPMLVDEDKYEQTVTDLEAKGYTFEKPEDEGLTLSQFLTQMRSVDAAEISVPAKKAQKQALMKKYGHILPEIKEMKLKEMQETYGPLLDVAEPDVETVKVMAHSPKGIKQPLLVPKEQFNETVENLLEKGWTFEEAEEEKFGVTPWYLKPERIGTPEGKAALNKAIKAGTKFDIKQINNALYEWTHNKEGDSVEFDRNDLFTLGEMLKGTGYKLRKVTVQEPKERWWWWDSVTEKPKWILENAQGEAIPPAGIASEDSAQTQSARMMESEEPATVEQFEAEVARLKVVGDMEKARAYYDKWVGKWQ